MVLERSWMARVAAVALVVAVPAAAAARQLLTRDEALALAYPGATVNAERIFLTEAQVKQVAEVSGTEMPSGLVARYLAKSNGQVIGRAYVDTHTVRTKRETLLISLDTRGQVKRVDTTAFLEPSEYRAPEAFVKQFSGRSLSDDLRLQRAIRPVAGATLTARSITDAVRRVLAIDAVLK